MKADAKKINQMMVDFGLRVDGASTEKLIGEGGIYKFQCIFKGQGELLYEDSSAKAKVLNVTRKNVFPSLSSSEREKEAQVRISTSIATATAAAAHKKPTKKKKGSSKTASGGVKVAQAAKEKKPTSNKSIKRKKPDGISSGVLSQDDDNEDDDDDDDDVSPPRKRLHKESIFNKIGYMETGDLVDSDSDD
jgi:hypothetical protein